MKARIFGVPRSRYAGPDFPDGPLQDDDWAGDDAPESSATNGAVWCSCEECRPEWHYGMPDSVPADPPDIDPAKLDMIALGLIDDFAWRSRNWQCMTVDDGKRLDDDSRIWPIILAHHAAALSGRNEWSPTDAS